MLRYAYICGTRALKLRSEKEIKAEGADPPVFLFLHLLAEVHCGSLDERALLVRG